MGLVGPDSSNAQVAYGPGSSTFPWDDGSDLHLAVTLKGSKDAVQIVPPPLPLCPTIASLSPSGDSSWWGTGMRVSGWACKGDGWFGSVKESLDLLSAALSREIPEGFIAKKLLPEVGVGTIELDGFVRCSSKVGRNAYRYTASTLFWRSSFTKVFQGSV